MKDELKRIYDEISNLYETSCNTNGYLAKDSVNLMKIIVALEEIIVNN